MARFRSAAVITPCVDERLAEAFLLDVRVAVDDMADAKVDAAALVPPREVQEPGLAPDVELPEDLGEQTLGQGTLHSAVRRQYNPREAPMEPSERRQHTRVPLDGRMVGRATMMADFRVVALAETGASLETRLPMALGSTCDLSLSLGEATLELKGRVANARAPGGRGRGTPSSWTWSSSP